MPIVAERPRETQVVAIVEDVALIFRAHSIETIGTITRTIALRIAFYYAVLQIRAFHTLSIAAKWPLETLIATILVGSALEVRAG